MANLELPSGPPIPDNHSKGDPGHITDHNRIASWLKWAEPSILPAGAVTLWAMDDAPDGWIVCDGRNVSRAQYPELFAIIGTRFGAGDGSTSFAVPNLSGRTARGAKAGLTVGTTGGAETHGISISNMPSHSHGGSTGGAGNHAHSTDAQGSHSHGGGTGGGGGHAHGYRGAGDRQAYGSGNLVAASWGTPGGYATDGAGDHGHGIGADGGHGHNLSASGDHGHGIGAEGGGAALETLDPFLVLNYIIKGV